MQLDAMKNQDNTTEEEKRFIKNIDQTDKTSFPLSFWVMNQREMLPVYRAEASDFYRSDSYYTVRFHKPISRYLKY